MTEAGMKYINSARQNGSWTILDSVDALIVPDYLQLALDANPNSHHYYLSLRNSIKKRILYWFVSAKRTETREKRTGILGSHDFYRCIQNLGSCKNFVLSARSIKMNCIFPAGNSYEEVCLI